MNNAFEQYKLHDFLIESLNQSQITAPTQIQQQTIPAILKGKDVLGQSQTGTGKTLAYLLPIIQMIDQGRQELQALILVPTRELTTQIGEVIDQLIKGTELDVVQLQGGVDVNRQIQRLKRNPHIAVGTPGRVLDLINQNKLTSHTAKFLVIDEADTMLEMGFMEEIEKIIQHMKRDSQIMLFSATLPQQVTQLAKTFMNQPSNIQVNPEDRSLAAIDNVFFKVRVGGKEEALAKIMKVYNPYLAIVFTKKKEHVEELVTLLARAGFKAEGLHGDLQQRQRKQVMKRFSDATTQVLVATDIASRGLDVENITHIINFDLPISVDQYVHRIGRTGRAGETGIAASLILATEEEKLRRIEEKMGKAFSEKIIYKEEIIDKPRRGKKKIVEEERQKAKEEKKAAKKGGKPAAKKATGPNAKKRAIKEAKLRIRQTKKDVPTGRRTKDK